MPGQEARVGAREIGGTLGVPGVDGLVRRSAAKAGKEHTAGEECGSGVGSDKHLLSKKSSTQRPLPPAADHITAEAAAGPARRADGRRPAGWCGRPKQPRQHLQPQPAAHTTLAALRVHSVRWAAKEGPSLESKPWEVGEILNCMRRPAPTGEASGWTDAVPSDMLAVPLQHRFRVVPSPTQGAVPLEVLGPQYSSPIPRAPPRVSAPPPERQTGIPRLARDETFAVG